MSGRIPQSFIDELLTRCDLVELIDTRVPLRKMGTNYSACCPFHNEKTPSFTVSPSKQFYHCFGCGVSGNAIGFLMEFEHIEFLDAIEILALQAGLEIPVDAKAKPHTDNFRSLYELLARATEFFKEQLKQHPQAIQYLKQRGLSGQIAKEFNLGFAPPGWESLLKELGTTPEMQQQLITCGMAIKKDDGSSYDRFRERIMFPIRDRRGQVIAFGGRALGDGMPKYLNSPETPVFHKGRELYGLYEARQANRELPYLLIVEGYMDLIALAQHDIRGVVATLGTATTADHLQLLLRVTHEIVFCFDGDNAGKSAAWRALEVALPLAQDGVQINFMFLPDGEDPDSLIRKEGKENFSNRIKAALPLSEFFFQNISTQLDLNSIEGKARLAKPAGSLLSKMPPGVFRLRMFDRLAEIVRVESQQLQSLAGLKPEPTTSRSKRAPTIKPTRRLSPTSLAISLLLQNPQLSQNIAEINLFTPSQIPGVPLLLDLMKHIRQHPQLNTGTLLEHWRDKADYDSLNKLASWQHNIPEHGIHHEFEGALQRIKESSAEKHIDQLLAKANHEGLTLSEKQQLQQLISQSKNT